MIKHFIKFVKYFVVVFVATILVWLYANFDTSGKNGMKIFGAGVTNRVDYNTYCGYIDELKWYVADYAYKEGGDPLFYLKTFKTVNEEKNRMSHSLYNGIVKGDENTINIFEGDINKFKEFYTKTPMNPDINQKFIQECVEGFEKGIYAYLEYEMRA